ncbi:helix-turn-helix domain-containing protein [Collinsella sp. AGMB00827]|uniref:Helix-turn-helix domain-containing protein n=1 Tax=Collinsella ureilytica TaxID=2869515 RepID=A0ABS7MLU1_9ACTN|nr:helix-turn-helix domain-containing protein [Collinsella urealyticum]MBY4798319.1 helix-turn-helix domain-containing protein [Collinsella urealyticum]
MNTTTKQTRREGVTDLLARLESVRSRMDIAEAIDVSTALKFAVAAGLPPKLAYTFSETARFTGFDERSLRNEMDAGRLHAVCPVGQARGYRIPVKEVDRWMEEEF